jgi:hypothetical protein
MCRIMDFWQNTIPLITISWSSWVRVAEVEQTSLPPLILTAKLGNGVAGTWDWNSIQDCAKARPI